MCVFPETLINTSEAVPSVVPQPCLIPMQKLLARCCNFEFVVSMVAAGSVQSLCVLITSHPKGAARDSFWYNQLSPPSHVYQPCHLDCGGNVPRLTMMNHIQTTCPKRQVTCNYCRVKLRQFEFREHCKTCPDYPIQCKCGVNVARKMVSSHEALCPEHLVACPYSWVGCNHKFPRKGQASHEMEYMTIHNKYMLATIIKGEEGRL